MKNFILLILMLCFLLACSNIEFSYIEDELNNQLYNKTNIIITGDEIPFLNTIVLSKFGISQNEFLDLEINISEKKTKMVIKTNQVSTRIDYDILAEKIGESVGKANMSLPAPITILDDITTAQQSNSRIVEGASL